LNGAFVRLLAATLNGLAPHRKGADCHNRDVSARAISSYRCSARANRYREDA
jgi:hypothetical protein